jgi:inosose dehydratase
MSSLALRDRIAGAPISWGVCEAPGWGHELAADRVLAEMAALGLRVTELGPTGYLGATAPEVRARLGEHGLRLIGGFLPVPLHVQPRMDLSEAEEAIAVLAGAGAEVVVLAARSTDGSYDHKVVLSEDEWPVLLANLDRLVTLIAGHGLRATLHPHVGTAIESGESVLRLLGSSEVDLCLDTGHLLIGGMQPLQLLDGFADRISHVHLKDVRTAVADPVAAGRISYLDAVRAGLYTPLGAGDLDIAAIVAALEAAGYLGWYVLEQDRALDGEPPAGQGPIADANRSIDYLRTLSGA